MPGRRYRRILHQNLCWDPLKNGVFVYTGADVFDDFSILARLTSRPSHPYQLLEDLHQFGFKITRSTLYRRVDVLVTGGYLESREEPGERGKPRRSLYVTAAGRRRLRKEAGDALREEPMESPIFALALACAQKVGASAVPEMLQVRMSRATSELSEEEEVLAREAEDTWFRAAHERRIAHLKADIDWLQTVLSRESGVIRARRRRVRRAVG